MKLNRRNFMQALGAIGIGGVLPAGKAGGNKQTDKGPTLQEVSALTGTILSVNGMILGLIGGMVYKRNRPGIVRVEINREIRDAHMTFMVDTEPHVKYTVQIYEASELDKRWINLAEPLFLWGPRCFYDVQIQEP